MAKAGNQSILPDRVAKFLTRLAVNAALGLPFFLIGVFGITASDLSDLSLIFLAIVILGAAIVLIGFYGSVLTRPRPNPHAGRANPRTPPSLHEAGNGPDSHERPLLPRRRLHDGLHLPPLRLPLRRFPRRPVPVSARRHPLCWINHHTIYYVTNRRVAHAYKFLWLDTTEIPVGSINAISETRNFIEMLTGRGSVLVASGISDRHTVRMQEIDDPGPVAQAIRSQISERRQDSN